LKLVYAALRWLLQRLYHIEVRGLEHLKGLEKEKILVVANHTSYLDGVLLFLFLPFPVTFAINTEQHRRWFVRMVRGLADFVALDPLNPLSTRSLIQYLDEGKRIVIFPEGRITVTGALMKIYNGPALVAAKSGAKIVPVAIQGAQYTPFSRLKGKIRLRMFPRIALTILPAREIKGSEALSSRAQREYGGKVLADLMTETLFTAMQTPQTLFEKLLQARQIHGGKCVVMEDVRREPLSYNAFLTRSLILGKQLEQRTARDEAVGVLLPNSTTTVVSFWALLAFGRVPAMLNYTSGSHLVVSACESAEVRLILTSRQFIEKANLHELARVLEQRFELLYLEDLAPLIGRFAKMKGLLVSRSEYLMKRSCDYESDPEKRAVVLFTSGSEGDPKGVVLSHHNLVSNIHQVYSRVGFNSSDVVLNILPLFHSFGLTGGSLVPLLTGVRSFYYPSPLHYRVIPEVAYDINATILFGSSTFLGGYAKAAHPYDFYSMRYVVAGAERLQPQVRALWQQKFGLRIFEGYGTTECSPVVAVNTPLEYREGSVGCLMPGMEARLEPMPGLEEGGRLQLRGPNIMKGYLLHDHPGQLVPAPEWYDTGDIATIDEQGFISIKGRGSRFAKIGGEMVSLVIVEALALRLWPDGHHVALARPDPSKGERIVLLTTVGQVERSLLAQTLKEQGISEIYLPQEIIVVAEIPLLATGKVDVMAAQALLNGMCHG